MSYINRLNLDVPTYLRLKIFFDGPLIEVLRDFTRRVLRGEIFWR